MKSSVYITPMVNGFLFYAVQGDRVMVSGNGGQTWKVSAINQYYVRGNMKYSHTQFIPEMA